MGHKQNYQPLLPEWEGALLGDRLRDRLVAARQELAATVAEIQAQLQQNPLVKVAAKDLARQCGRRVANPSISVDTHGVLLLTMYAEPKNGVTRQWRTTLPSLEALREQALKLGLDPLPFGRNKRKLLDAVQAAERAPPPPTRKRVKQAPALAVAVLNSTADPAPPGSLASRFAAGIVDLDTLLHGGQG